MKSSNASRKAVASASSAAREPLEQTVDPGVERGGERRRRPHHATQLPERVGRGGRVDAADAGDERHGQGGVADRGAHALDHTERHRGAVGDVEVLGEQPAELGGVAAEPGDELGVGQRRRSRAGGPELGHLALVGFEVGELGGREDPPEGRLDRVGLRRVVVAGHRLVGRHALHLAPERVVHLLRGEARGADAEDPGDRGVEVAVAAEAPDDLGVRRRELARRRRRRSGPARRASPARRTGSRRGSTWRG